MAAFWTVEQIEADLFGEARYAGDIDDADEARAAAEAAVLPPSPYKSDDVYEMVSTVLMRYRRGPGNVRWQRYASFQAEVDYKAERYEAARKVLDEATGWIGAGRRATGSEGPCPRRASRPWPHL